jgi:hypothetical protein
LLLRIRCFTADNRIGTPASDQALRRRGASSRRLGSAKLLARDLRRAREDSRMAAQGLYATELLRQEHRRVRELFARYESPDIDPGERPRLLSQIAMALSVHLRVEEEVLHPAARDVLDEDGRALIDEAAVENVPQKYFLIELITSRQADRLFRARMKVIRRYFEYHVREEERRLLPLLETSGIDQAALGLQIAACREALLAAAAGPVRESMDDL